MADGHGRSFGSWPWQKDIAKEAEKKYNILTAELNMMKSEKGGIDAQKFWQLNKKINPRSRDPPTSIYDKKGNLLAADKAIEERVIEANSDRLAPNNIKEK